MIAKNIMKNKENILNAKISRKGIIYCAKKNIKMMKNIKIV